jgi:hypothetical protein
MGIILIHQTNNLKMIFTKEYPHIAWWVDNSGWMIMGNDEDSDSILRLIDTSGLWWEDDTSDTLDKAFDKAELFLSKALIVRFPNRFKLA